MNYVTRLAFDKRPDFEYLKNLVIDAATEAQLNIYDGVYDWSSILADYHYQKSQICEQAGSSKNSSE